MFEFVIVRFPAPAFDSGIVVHRFYAETNVEAQEKGCDWLDRHMHSKDDDFQVYQNADYRKH